MKITLYCAPDETVADGLRDFLRIAKAQGLTLKRASRGGSRTIARAMASTDQTPTDQPKQK